MRDDVDSHVLVVCLYGRPALQEHEFVRVVLALKQLEGLAAICSAAEIAALDQQREQLVGMNTPSFDRAVDQGHTAPLRLGCT